MSKKKVVIKMPLKQATESAPVQAEERSAVEPNGAHAGPPPPSPYGVDKWVMHDDPIRVAEARLIGMMPDMPAPTAATRVLIDLTTERTWFELIRLICVFPYMAVCFWTWNAMGKWLGSYDRPQG